MQLWDDLMTLLIAGLDMNFLSFSSGLLHKLQILYHFSWFLFGYACSTPWVHNCSQGLWHMNSVNFSTLILELRSYIHTGLGWFFCFCRTLLLRSAHLCCNGYNCRHFHIILP